MSCYGICVFTLMFAALLAAATPSLAAYDLEVPPNPREEYRQQFTRYSKQLQKSYDRAFVDDYEGAVREVSVAIGILPDEGLGYAERAKYQRLLSRQDEADADLRRALTLFDQAIRRYRSGKGATGKKARKPQKGELPQIDPAGSAQLIATLHYQRGEAYFGFDQYRKAGEDFSLACKGGSAIACSRLQEVKRMELRGLNWAPLTSRQFYDRQRIERPAEDVVRVWVRREDDQPPGASGGQGGDLQQQLEFRCTAREFRVVDPPDPAPGFSRPALGSAAGKLVNMLCPRSNLK